MIPPSYARRYHDAGHFPPRSGLDHSGGTWIGASRIVDRPGRRRQNRRSWARMKADARRAYVMKQQLAEVMEAIKPAFIESTRRALEAPSPLLNMARARARG